MNGFLVLGYKNSARERIQIDLFEKFFKLENKFTQSNHYHSELYDNLVGYQIFQNNKHNGEFSLKNVLLNGKIFGKINDINNKKLSYEESLSFVSQNINNDNNFFGFDGSCTLAVIKESSIIFQSDTEGHKKIFYYKSQDIFCASSNLTYIFKIIKNHWKIRKNAVYSYILQRESKWPLTFIDGIKVLPPLTKATLTKNDFDLKSAILSDFYKPKNISKKQLIHDVYDDYQRIINRESSNNIAVTLSGGYDSNCLTKLYLKSYVNKFTAVSLGYTAERERDNNVYDETIYAEKIAKHLNIPFKKYIVDKKYFLSKIDCFIKALDQPGHDPSSNFLLNDLLKKDGFDSVVSGMGGDAFFSSKLKLNITRTLYNLTKNNSLYTLLNFTSKQLKFKSFLKNFDTKSFLKTQNSFVELREIENFNKSTFDEFINNNVKKELFDEVDSRINYYKRIEKASNVKLEEYYSYSLLSNPDEYHADIMAQRNDLNIIMPFINTGPVLKLLNASKFINITNREFEMEIFNGINKELLLKSKSGFSFPYTEWVGEFSKDTINFFKDLDYFNDSLFNIDKFVNSYEKDINMRNSLATNQLIWKLTVVKKYAEHHSIDF